MRYRRRGLPMLGWAFFAAACGAAASAAAGPYSVIYHFQGKGTGGLPANGLATGAAGTLYGLASYYGVNKCGTAFSLTVPASGGTPWSYKVLHQFGPAPAECKPNTTPTVQGDFLVGTTFDAPPGYGSVFRFRPGGAYATLHTFDGTNGDSPTGDLLVGANGQVLYGTTYGVLYQTGPSGGYRVLHVFRHGSGENPSGNLTFGPDGAIYGTTLDNFTPGDGGAGAGHGVVFRVTTGGVYSVLYSFDDTANGLSPTGRIAFGPDGTLYGTTSEYGTKRGGTAYALTPGATGQPWTLKVIYQFGAPSGEYPHGLIRDTAGNLYGTASFAGPSKGGTLWRLSPPTSGQAWTFTLLHGFGISSSDGNTPNGDLLLNGGALYGMTRWTGLNVQKTGPGTAFTYLLP